MPDIGRIPEEERAFYERFMCTSIHNPNRVDLAQDVLFELISPDYARTAVERIDASVWDPLEKALELFERGRKNSSAAGSEGSEKVFRDQHTRIRALQSLYETLRNTALWIYAVHTYVKSADPEERARMRDQLAGMIEREIRNCVKLKELWEEAEIEWMIVSGSEETPFIYAPNLGTLLERKVELMREYGDHEPRIDPEYMFRVASDPYAESSPD